MKIKLTITAIVASLMIFVAACGSSAEAEDNTPKTSVYLVTKQNYGWTEVNVNGVRCFIHDGYHESGISCDWSPK